MFNSGQPKPMIYRFWNLATHSHTTLRPNIDYHGTDAVLMLQSYPANQKNQSPKVHCSLYPAITNQMRQFRVASLSHDHDFTVVLCSFQISISSLWSPMGLSHFLIPLSKLPTNSYQLMQDGLTNVISSEKSTDLLSTPGQLKRTVHLALRQRTSGQSGVPCTIS